MKLKIKSVLLISLSLLVISCGTTTVTPTTEQSVSDSPFTYVDSTQYFAEETASVSMRATFDNNNDAGSKMVSGYKFQFRTINDRPVFLSSISIIAGGKRLFIEEGQVVLPNQKGVTLTLPLEDSNLVAQYPSALLQFKVNNQSELFTIELHQLKEFSP